MTIYRSGPQAAAVKLAGTDVSKVYLSGEKVWPVKPLVYKSISALFNSDADLAQFPYQAFDGRTHASSPRRKGWTFNSMLVAGDNNYPTYWDMVTDFQFKDSFKASVYMGDVMNTLTFPMGIILSSNADMSRFIMLNIGSNGIEFRKVQNNSTISLRTFSATIAKAQTIDVTRSATGLYTVKRGTTTLGSYQPTENDDLYLTEGHGYAGLSMYSTNGAWCSRVGNFYVEGNGYE